MLNFNDIDNIGFHSNSVVMIIICEQFEICTSIAHGYQIYK